MANITTSKQFSLKFMDFLKGALLAVISAVLMVVQQSLDRGEFSFNWKTIGMTGVGAFMAYLIKNFVDKPKVIINAGTNDKAEAIKKDLE